MVHVCEEWFPLGSFKGQKQPGFYIDGYLKQSLDLLIKNIVNDWDFTIIITGGGEVRVGKSFLASQIAIYWTYMMEKVHGIKVPYTLRDNFVYNWDDLINKGNKLASKSKYCPFIYDEAGDSLEGGKVMTSETKAVLDYLRECGQYNFLNILVLPEFFTLPRGVALTRSKLLLDVYYVADENGMFQRGHFRFYSQKNKKKLYLNGKKTLNYFAAPHNFFGRFTNFFPLDKEKYKDMKIQALRNRDPKKKNRHLDQRNRILKYLMTKLNVTATQLSKLLEGEVGVKLSRQAIEQSVKGISLENEGFATGEAQITINNLSSDEGTVPKRIIDAL